MKPTIFEICGTDAKSGKQLTLTKLIFGDVTIGKLLDNWKKEGIKIHYFRIVSELDLAPDELLFYIEENRRNNL